MSRGWTIVVYAIGAWLLLAFVIIGLPWWVTFWYGLSHGAAWGLACAFGPFFLALGALVGWARTI